MYDNILIIELMYIVYIVLNYLFDMLPSFPKCSLTVAYVLQLSGLCVQFNSVISMLQQQASVHWIEEDYTPHVQNNNAQWVTQSAVNETRPIWAAHINGTGQIVGYDAENPLQS